MKSIHDGPVDDKGERNATTHSHLIFNPVIKAILANTIIAEEAFEHPQMLNPSVASSISRSRYALSTISGTRST